MGRKWLQVGFPWVVLAILLGGCGPLAAPSAPPSVLPQPTRIPVPTIPTAVPTPPPSGVEFRSPQRYRARLTVTATNGGFALDHLLLYLPKPIDWDEQWDVVVESVSPEPRQEGSDPVHGNSMYYWELWGQPSSGESTSFEIVFTFTAWETVARVNLADVRPYDRESPLYRLYTRPEALIESEDPKIVALANQLAATLDNPYLIARADYDYVADTIRYELGTTGSGARFVLDNGAGECGHFAALFVALCRAQGIPARPVVGHWAISGLDQYHVWAEFYLEGIGWVPVDPTIAQQSEYNRRYYFGHMDNQRVVLSKGYNIELVPEAPSDIRVVPFLQGPWYWFWGDGDSSTFDLAVTGWEVNLLAQPTAAAPTATAEPAAPAAGAPTILGVELRGEQSGGELVIYQDVRFSDPEGDVVRWDFEIVSTTDPGVSAEGGVLEIPGAEQRAGTVVTGEWHCGGGAYSVVLRVTLVDAAGNRSAPAEYTLECQPEG